MFSPKAELARNALAERAKARGAGGDDDGTGDAEDNLKQLPDDEYVDFLTSYDDQKWWKSATEE